MSAETWQVKLGIGGIDGTSFAPIEGVRIGYGTCDDYYYKPVELPRHVWDFLGGRIVPADYMWPYYIDAKYKTLEQVMNDPPAGATIADPDESIIEFILEVSE